MERLYDYCVSYTTGSIGTPIQIKPRRPCWPRESINTESTGLEVCIMPSNLRLRVFVTSTIVSLPFWSCWRLTRGCSILTLISIMEMELRRLSTWLIELWLAPSINSRITSLGLDILTMLAKIREHIMLWTSLLMRVWTIRVLIWSSSLLSLKLLRISGRMLFFYRVELIVYREIDWGALIFPSKGMGRRLPSWKSSISLLFSLEEGATLWETYPGVGPMRPQWYAGWRYQTRSLKTTTAYTLRQSTRSTCQ